MSENPVTNEKPSKVGGVLKGLLIMAIYLVIGSIPQLFVLVPIMLEAMAEGGTTGYSEILMQKMAENSAGLTISTAVGTFLAVLTMFLWYFFGVYKKEVKNGTYESVVPKLKDSKAILFIIAGSIAGYAVAVLIMDFALWLMPSIGGAYLQSMDAVMGGVDILGFVLTLILAPIGEEICIRGLGINRLKQSYGLAGCVVLSGIFFGIYHLNPIQGLYAIPMGMFFGYLAYKFNSIVPCVLAHFVNNLMATFSGVLGFNTLIVPIAVLVVFGTLTVLIGRKVDMLHTNASETE